MSFSHLRAAQYVSESPLRAIVEFTVTGTANPSNIQNCPGFWKIAWEKQIDGVWTEFARVKEYTLKEATWGVARAGAPWYFKREFSAFGAEQRRKEREELAKQKEVEEVATKEEYKKAQAAVLKAAIKWRHADEDDEEVGAALTDAVDKYIDALSELAVEL